MLLRFSQDSPSGSRGTALKVHTLVEIPLEMLTVDNKDEEFIKGFLEGSPASWDKIVSQEIWEKYKPLDKSKKGKYYIPSITNFGAVYLEEKFQQRITKARKRGFRVTESKLIREFIVKPA